jgi:hypothetical protein
MLKIVVRCLIIACIAVALGLLIYHLNQPAGTASVGSAVDAIGRFSHDLGGEGGFRESGSGLSRGLFGTTQNLVLIAVVTFIVASIQKGIARQPKPVRTR